MREHCPRLLKAHRSYCVNPYQMLGYAVDTENQRVHLMFKNGTRLTIGRGRTVWDEFVEQFELIKTKQDDNGNWI